MSKPIDSDDDRISALADGCLHGDDFAQTLSDMAARPEMVQTWHAYQVIGDVMRSDELACTADDLGFLTRFEARLAREHVQPPLSQAAPSLVVKHAAMDSANAPSLRWKWLSGLALSALVSVVGLGLWSPNQQPSIAVATDPADAQIMIRDPQLDALMAAHQQLGGHSALQMPAGFLRNATFERPAR